MADETHRIPHLLSGACLLTGAYDADARELRLSYECLRRSADGSELTDRTVTLHLGGVTGITVAYDGRWLRDRPSQFRLPEDARLERLVPWPLPATELVDLSVDSADAVESVVLAAHRESLVETDAGDGDRLVCLHVDQGIRNVPTIVAVRCASIVPYAGGRPLPLETWAQERAAWWRAWEAHWAAQEEGGGDTAPVDEDAFIPAGTNEVLDRSYAPPERPAFDCPPSDAPEELLTPVRIWFEAGITLDAAKRVSVAPDLDVPPDERIAVVHAFMTGDGFGSWDYAREVEGWWIEGDRAFVGVVGVTHSMPEDGEPAGDRLIRFEFALRRREGTWQIHAQTSGLYEEPVATGS